MRYDFPLALTTKFNAVYSLFYRSEIYRDSRQQTAEGGGTAEKDL